MIHNDKELNEMQDFLECLEEELDGIKSGLGIEQPIAQVFGLDAAKQYFHDSGLVLQIKKNIGNYLMKSV